MSQSPRDALYARPRDLVDFAFDEAVARVFPDMIRRLVPGYETVVSLIGVIAERYARPHSRCYDLGCSLGAATLAMAGRIRAPDCRIVAVDNAPAMAARCRDNVADSPVPVDVICADLRDVRIATASVVVLNFTLQFVAPDERPALLRALAEGMLPGAALVLSEKVVFEDAAEQSLQEALQLDFKRANGYSELEIGQKRAALERVLIPDSLETHHRRLREAGFGAVYTWFRCFNFASILALK